MRKLWECNDWSRYVMPNGRKGIRLRFDKGVDKEVIRACKEYVNWLRRQYEFPVRVPIYFKATPFIYALSGERVSATFLGPYDKSLEPYIRVAVGDYPELLKERGQDNALAGILGSITHELSHYFQWIKDSEIGDKQRERQAKYYAREILYDYAEIRDHP